jgi:hypothetical protein
MSRMNCLCLSHCGKTGQRLGRSEQRPPPPPLRDSTVIAASSFFFNEKLLLLLRKQITEFKQTHWGYQFTTTDQRATTTVNLQLSTYETHILEQYRKKHMLPAHKGPGTSIRNIKQQTKKRQASWKGHLSKQKEGTSSTSDHSNVTVIFLNRMMLL